MFHMINFKICYLFHFYQLKGGDDFVPQIKLKKKIKVISYSDKGFS